MTAEVTKMMETVHIEARKDANHPMMAAEWHGKENIKVHERPKPMVTDPKDVILNITSTAICGSDLHLYLGCFPAMKEGDVLGHEFMGIVEEVGPEVKSVKKGDRVVASFDIACGECFYCERELYSACDTTNPPTPDSIKMESIYGHKTSGIFGYSHLTGGFEGGQAEYARVPFGDVNLLKLPEDLPDERVLFLSDILPTAWHANELARVGKGDRVAIWGAGPVGILAAHCALHRGAHHVMLIDRYDYRLAFAKTKLDSPKVSTVNYTEVKDLKEALFDIVGKNGVDCGIDAVGVHYTKSWTHKLQTVLKMETDPSDVVNEMIRSVRKGGNIGIVGVYTGSCNNFNLGGFMEKGLSMAGGQTPVQKYWKTLLEKVKAEELKPELVLTHVLPLAKAAEGYKMFNEKESGCIKVILKPHASPAA